jgi:hypothetical protein
LERSILNSSSRFASSLNSLISRSPGAIPVGRVFSKLPWTQRV